MEILTVKQAVARVNSGENLAGVVLDKDSIQQVNVRDAMVLSSGGIVIPEQNIYYDDDDIQYDEDIDGLTITSGITDLSWEEKARRAAAQPPKAQGGEGIAYDEAFEGDWVPAANDGLAEAEAALHLRLQLDPTIKAWLEQQPIPPSQLLEQLLVNFYRAERLLRDGERGEM